MLPTGPLDDSAVSYAKAFMATLKKKNPKDTSDSFENSEIYDHKAHPMMVKRLKHQMKVLPDQTKFLDYQAQKIQKMI